MKRYVIGMLLATPLFISTQSVNADPLKVQHPIIKNKIHKEPLMASHLPGKLANNLQAAPELSYATGHTFYDTPVELVDEQGKKIHFKQKLNSKSKYKMVVSGATTQTADNIWFFSPTGVNPEKIDSYACVSEAPCRQITQQLIDYARQYSFIAPKFWFATGTYDLPTVQQGKLNPKLIELYDQQAVVGRTSDFRRFAYDDERPLILGTLAWIDYSVHSGEASGFVSSVKIHTLNNQARISDIETNTNLYGIMSLSVDNCDLKIEAKYFAYNVYAKYSYVHDSHLIAKGYNAHNVYSPYLNMWSANLEAKGTYASNIIAASISGVPVNQVFVEDSNLSSKPDNCVSGSTGILSNGSLIYLNNVNLDVRVKTRCEKTYSTAVELNSNPDSLGVIVQNSTIKIFAEASVVTGIESINAPIYLDNSKVYAQSLDFQAYGLMTWGHPVVFAGDSSLLTVVAPYAQAFNTGDATVLNNSNPPSKCIINGETEVC